MFYRISAGALIAALALCGFPSDPTPVRFTSLDPFVIQHRLELVPRKLPDRKAVLTSLFEEVGCTGQAFSEQRVPGSAAPNLICVLRGASDSEIVVGGHFDSIELGMGAVDDWSGAALLPSLYQSLKDGARRHRFVFVGFAGEEGGLRGSKEFVRRLPPDELHRIHAMINLECLGIDVPKVWARRADPQLLDYYARVSSSLHVEARGMNVDDVGDDDSHSFLNAHIPVLTIFALSRENFAILHNRRDNLSAIHPEQYYTAYRVAATYLAYLDANLP